LKNMAVVVSHERDVATLLFFVLSRKRRQAKQTKTHPSFHEDQDTHTHTHTHIHTYTHTHIHTYTQAAIR
jgi:hypothetical protein